MNKKDELWKAAIEEFFPEFLELFYPELLPEIDFQRKFDFLDKDLPKLFPNAREINRKADKIVKIPLKNGDFQWLIIHIEVQGYKDANFARRMFTYYYRLADRFDVPIAAIVIYSDDNQENRVSKYESNCLNTRLLYEFDTYVIADHSEKEYAVMDNPFAIILQTALVGIRRNKKDEELLELKMQLLRNLLEKGYDRKQIQQITTFIREYVHFTKPEFNRKFDKQSEELFKNRKNMGIIETVLKYRTEEAREQGLEQGRVLEAALKDFEHKVESISRLSKNGLSVEHISLFLEMNTENIKELIEGFTLVNNKILRKEIQKIRLKFSANYSLEMLQHDLIQLLLSLKFSEKTISKTLKCPLGLVKKIKKIQ